MDLYITNEKQLATFLNRLVSESHADDVDADERLRQKKMQDDLKGLRASDTKKEVDEAEDETDEAFDQPGDEPVAKAAVEKPSEKKIASASIQDIIKTLNVMRSGRSTKDPDVRTALKSYIDGLTTGEQQSLYAFLSGLAEMMVAGEPGKEATEPSSAGIKVSTAKLKPGPSTTSGKKTKEKGTPGAPIVVGERADRSLERRRLRELSK
jgi:hypothetical protein